MHIKKGDDVFIWDKRYPRVAPRVIIVAEVSGVDSKAFVRETSGSVERKGRWYGADLVYATSPMLLEAMRTQYRQYENTARCLEQAIKTIESMTI